MDFSGHLYRALNPAYARAPLSGRGAQLHGGRFNPKGAAALYASLSIQTAIREANQAGTLQPTTLVSYAAEIGNIFDSRDLVALAAFGLTPSLLADNGWRDQMKARGKAATQEFAERLIADGFNGLLIQSFAPGARAGDLNMVLWKWGDSAPCRLVLIDDEGRLA